MRSDHTSYPLGGRYPTPEEIARAVSGAQRLRAEAVHAYLKRAANGLTRAVSWVRWLPLGPDQGDGPEARDSLLRAQRPKPNASATSSYERRRLA